MAVPQIVPGDATATGCDQAAEDVFGRVFTLLGKRWTGQVLAALLTDGPSVRFTRLARQMPGLGDSTLAARLTELVDAGLVSREVSEGPPVAVNYRLTESGRALGPVFDQLAAWARVHLIELGQEHR